MKLLSYILTFSAFFIGRSQVGVNTSQFSDGVAFEVTGNGAEGVILTRSNIEDLDTEFPLPVGIEDGTLTFNTNTITGLGYVWWDEPAHTWKFVDPFIGKKELYGNPVADNTAGDLNQDESAGFKIPIFGNPEFENSNNLYEMVGANAVERRKNLRVNAKGRYRIAVTLGLEAQEDDDSIDDNLVEIKIQVTSNLGVISYPGADQHSSEMEDNRTGEDDDGAVSFVEILELEEGDVLSLVSYRANNSGNNIVWLNSSRPSSFYIIKIN
ncbi:hypothetical protein AAU57_13335 [Nonlabens sp. YIK11]|uniref:hypothetical protein n=1 Tax=Nonlabens sp. YIK11 TaxID=1453349 RepID=UPI0006DD0D23|nr:hypothetical protein [Nonlabens sp. YIK11]KQC34207.1 hypothetical protein AAU57_13335 [Nonlabens sp. YIK11]